MRDNPAREAALRKLDAQDPAGALCEALLRSSRLKARRAISMLERLDRPVPTFLLDRCRASIRRAVIDNPGLTFFQAAHELRNGPYADYLYQRFANPSLLASIPVMLLLKELTSPAPRILEIGCGTGHANSIMSRAFPHVSFTITDGDFTNVYLARRFLSPTASCICLDAESRLPFADQSFDGIYCQDAFHYLREKAGLVDELRRVVRPGGIWLFPHLHNALGHNRAAGFPLPAHDYARLFSWLEPRLFPEAQILDAFHRTRRIDLSQSSDPSSIDSADVITLIAGPNSLWKEHDLSDLFLANTRGLGFNRIYQNAAAGNPGSIAWPSNDLHDECRLADRYLPASVRIDPALADRIARRAIDPADEPAVRDLIRNFVLVPLPENYG